MSIRRRRLIRVGGIGGSATAQIRNLLFSGAQQGVLFYPKPVVDGDQVLWQQSGGTVIVDTHGDPVGQMDDLSGNGNNATQVTSANKALYQTGSDLHWLTFDGVNDSIRTILPAAIPQPFTRITAFTARTADGRILGGGDDTNAQLWRESDGGRFRMFSGNTLSVAGVDVTATNIVVEVHNGMNSELRAITPLYDESIIGDAGTTSIDSYAIATRNNDLFSDMDYYGGVLVAGTLSAADTDKVINYLADLAGMAL